MKSTVLKRELIVCLLLLTSFMSLSGKISKDAAAVDALPVEATYAEDEPDVYDLIMGKIRQKEVQNISIASIDNQTKNYVESVGTDGSFTDIAYGSTAQTNWPPLAHLNRMKPVVLSYTTEGSQYYEDEDVYNKIVNMFQYWYDKHPASTNWYNPQIAEPQRLGVLLILMRYGKEQLPAAMENKIIARIASEGGAPDQSGSQGTGANKVDIATHWIYRGCLTKNKTVLDKGVQQVFYPLFLTTGEGFQHDFSYLQHGQQLYIGGYGDVIAQGICNVAQYVEGTSYEVSPERLDVLFDFMRKTYFPVIRGQYFLYNVAGRSLSRPNAMGKSGFHSVIESLKLANPANADDYDAAIKRVKAEEPASYGLQPYHSHYWRSDYTLHQRPGYTVDVRMVSTRTLRNENGNGENIKGYFLSEGAMDIAVNGNEYYNIFPVWDWGRIPGTTSPALTTIPRPAQWGTSGTSTFVGGVSDGAYGVSTFALKNNEHSINTEAKKSWFFFDNEIVCLGAEIKSTNATQINTTLDQCLLSGDVTVIKSDNAQEVFTTSQKGSRTYSDASWILHGNVGYYLPGNGNIVVNNETQSGSWQSINTSQSADPVSKDVFKLWFDHGVKPTEGQYAYVIVPNVNTVEKVNAYKTDDVGILSNTSSLQAVEHKGLGLVGIVFYTPGTFTYNENVSVRVTKPCVALIKNIKSDNVEVHITDPSKTVSNLSVVFKSPLFAREKELECTFSTEAAYAGSTRKYVINRETPNYVEDKNLFTLSPQADTYVNGSATGTNFSDNKNLFVQYSSGAQWVRRSYLEFDLTEVENMEKYGKVVLKLTVDTVQQNKVGTPTIEVRTVPQTFEAINTMTFSSNGEAVVAKGDKISPTVGFARLRETVVELDVTDYIFANSTNTSLRLQVSGVGPFDGNIYFYATEGATAGNLEYMPVLEFTPKPEITISADDNVIITSPSTASPYYVPSGEDFTVTFTLKEGYNTPLVVVDGLLFDVEKADGMFSFTFSEVKRNKSVVIKAYKEIILPAKADTYIDGRVVGNINFNATDLRVQASSSSYNRISYLEFDGSSLDETYDKVFLRLIYKERQSGKSKSPNFQVRTVPESVGELEQLTWSNSGEVNGVARKGDAIGSPVTFSLNSAAGTILEFDVTDNYILDKLGAQNIIRLAVTGLQDVDAGYYLFYSTEGAIEDNLDYMPVLVFEKTENSLDDVRNGAISVQPVNEGVIVKTNQAVKVNIYSVSGISVCGKVVEGTEMIPLKAGIYLVKSENRIFKIII